MILKYNVSCQKRFYYLPHEPLVIGRRVGVDGGEKSEELLQLLVVHVARRKVYYHQRRESLKAL
jgi:hypothetical protein